MTEPANTTNERALECLRVIPSGEEGQHRGSCVNCGRHLWSEGGYRIPGLHGLFCSLLCTECAIAGKTGKTKKVAAGPLGNGARLLAHLKTEAPQLYAKIAAVIATNKVRVCRECGVPLDGKRADAEYCSHVHQMRCRRRV